VAVTREAAPRRDLGGRPRSTYHHLAHHLGHLWESTSPNPRDVNTCCQRSNSQVLVLLPFQLVENS
jgi:hypothetical protein